MASSVFRALMLVFLFLPELLSGQAPDSARPQTGSPAAGPNRDGLTQPSLPQTTTQEEELLAYRLAAYSEWVREDEGKLILAGLLAVESARRVPNMPSRTALGRVNALAPRVEQILRVPEVSDIKISPDNRYLLVRTSEASPTPYSVWDLELRKVLFTFTADSATFSADSASIAAHCSEHPTEILRVSDGQRVARLAYAAPKSESWDAAIHPVTFSHGGRWLAEYTGNDELSISSTADWKLKRKIQGVRRFTFGKNDRWLLIVKEDGTADAWNLSNDSPPVTLSGPDPIDYALANDQSEFVLFGSSGPKGHLQTWSYSGALRTQGDDVLGFRPEALSDNGKVAVAANNDEDDFDDAYSIVMRLTNSMVQPLAKIYLRSTPLLTSDGSQLLDVANGFLYDSATGALRGRFEESDLNKQRTTAGTDFQRVVVSLGGKITVYAGKIDRTLPDPKPHAPGDTLNIPRNRPGSWAAKSPDQRFDAIADDDNLVLRVWEKGYPYVMLENVQGGDIDFTEDGRYIQRYDLRVEPFLTDDLIAETCSRVNRNLTLDEWTKYLGSISYRKTCPNIPDVADVPANVPSPKTPTAAADATAGVQLPLQDAQHALGDIIEEVALPDCPDTEQLKLTIQDDGIFLYGRLQQGGWGNVGQDYVLSLNDIAEGLVKLEKAPKSQATCETFRILVKDLHVKRQDCEALGHSRTNVAVEITTVQGEIPVPNLEVYTRWLAAGDRFTPVPKRLSGLSSPARGTVPFPGEFEVFAKDPSTGRSTVPERVSIGGQDPFKYPLPIKFPDGGSNQR